jgi:hypothetical protein
MVVRACIAVREGGRDDSPRSLPWMELVAPGWELLWFMPERPNGLKHIERCTPFSGASSACRPPLPCRSSRMRRLPANDACHSHGRLSSMAACS